MYMLQAIAEQKMALAAYASEHSIPQLTTNQLDIVGKIIALLAPIEEITKAISAESASSVSIVIPFVRMLVKTMERNDNDRGIQTMKTQMLTSLKRRFESSVQDEHLVLATVLDPRFKDKVFGNPGEKSSARELLR